MKKSMSATAIANPTWYVDERVIFHGQARPYDYYGAKDPTIVYYGGKYHVFYTGANQAVAGRCFIRQHPPFKALRMLPAPI